MMSSICLHPISLFLLALLFGSAVEAQPQPVRVIKRWQAGMSFPTDLAVDAQGRAWVVDGLNHRVLILRDGESTPREILNERFDRLLGIDILGTEVVLTDTKRHCLYFMDMAGSIQREMSLPEDCDPVDLLILDDRILVSDNDQHRILMLDRQGRLQRTIGRHTRSFEPPVPLAEAGLGAGESGLLAGEFSYPGILGRHNKGFLVVDVLGGRVQTFSPLGNFTRAFGNFATDGSGLFRPKGACMLEKSERMLITDGYVGTTSVYDSWGTRLGMLTLDGTPWRLKGPTAISAPPRRPDSGESTGEIITCWVVDSRASTVYHVELLSAAKGGSR